MSSSDLVLLSTDGGDKPGILSLLIGSTVALHGKRLNVFFFFIVCQISSFFFFCLFVYFLQFKHLGDTYLGLFA